MQMPIPIRKIMISLYFSAEDATNSDRDVPHQVPAVPPSEDPQQRPRRAKPG